VPDLLARPVSLIVCSSDAAALDALVAPGHGARTLRTAPDEALFLSSPDVAHDVAREVEDRIAALDGDALVLDVSDGWAAWTLRGDDAGRAFSSLSALDPPAGDGFVQGDVARVAAKVFVEDADVTILVPAYWREHLRRRAVEDARAREVVA
jgi:hypothetical protein